MKKLISAFYLVAFITPLVHAQNVSSEERDRAIQCLEKTRDGEGDKDLRAHAADSLLGKQLDGYEWVQEVKTDPDYPKQ